MSVASATTAFTEQGAEVIHPARYTTGTVAGAHPLLIAPRLVLVTACMIALLALGAAPSFAATPEPVGQFASPVYATAPPGDAQRLFVIERAGRIRVMRDGAALDQPSSTSRAA